MSIFPFWQQNKNSTITCNILDCNEHACKNLLCLVLFLDNVLVIPREKKQDFMNIIRMVVKKKI